MSTTTETGPRLEARKRLREALNVERATAQGNPMTASSVERFVGAEWLDYIAEPYIEAALATAPSDSLDARLKVADTAVAFVVWQNKVPSPYGYLEELQRREDAMDNAVEAYLGTDRWWAETYAPDGWSEASKAIIEEAAAAGITPDGDPLPESGGTE